MELKQSGPAQNAYKEAINAFDQALHYDSHLVATYNNRCDTLNRWTQCWIDLNEIDKAMEKNVQAENACCQGLNLTKQQHLPLLINMATAKFLHAILERKSGGANVASLLHEAMAYNAKALAISPNYPELLQQRQSIENYLCDI